MSRALLLPAGGDVVASVVEALRDRSVSLERGLAVFPGKRPAHFVYRALAREIGAPFRAPQVLSLDELTDQWHGRLEPATAPVVAADAVAELFHLQREHGLPGSPSPRLDLDEFLPWGFKFFSAFEELRIEGIGPERLRAVQSLAQERLSDRVRRQLGDLAGLYQAFYETLDAEKLSTRSLRYATVAGGIDAISLDDYDVIVLAGFFALTAAERMIFKRLLADGRVTMILQDGPGIGEMISALGIRPERAGGRPAGPKLCFTKAADAHGEVMAMAGTMARMDGPGETVIVLPLAETLFPVVESVLPAFGDDWNISMGYPLSRTPAAALLGTLAAAQAGRDGDRYYAPDYLRLLLHPYVKNIALARSSQAARILAHTIEERINDRQQRFVRLADLERDGEILDGFLKKAAGLDGGPPDAGQVTAHLTRLHDLLLRPFERPADIGGFAAALLAAVSHVSQHSPANRHPFAPAFIEAMIRSLDGMQRSRLARETLGDAAGYFRFADNALAPAAVPFDGTPLKRLQVLGFLETRALRFRTVHILDCNEGVLPHGRQPDSILPQALRRELGLPGQGQRDGIVRYYFENLIAGASEAHVYYREGADQEKSRLVERLLWREQQAAASLDGPPQAPVFFASAFDQRDPDPVPKNEDMTGALRILGYSASKLDAYLKCPLAFHYRYLLDLKEPVAPAGGIEQRQIGTIVHGILEEFFLAKRGRPLALTDRDCDSATAICHDRFRAAYGDHLDGALCLIQSQVETRLADIVAHHGKTLAGTVIEACECTLSAPLDTRYGQIALTGRIDRIDRRPEGVVIIDYKTGAAAGKPNNRRFTLAGRAQWHRTVKSFQLPLYLILYAHHHPAVPVADLNSALMLLGGTAIEETQLFGAGDDRQGLLEGYRLAMVRLIEEIMDPGIPFGAAPDPDAQCPNCSYKTPCGRQWMKPRS